MNTVKKYVVPLFLLLLVLGSFPTRGSAAVSGPLVPSQPVSLLLTVIPPVLPADDKTYGAVVVSLVDGTGKGSLAADDTSVYITSSQENVGTVSAVVTISAGAAYAVANLTTTTTPGTTEITASSVGVQSANAQVKTVTPSGFPTSLKVFPVPDSVIAGQSYSGNLIVEMQDDTGLPAKAVSNTTVLLSSSDSSVLGLPQSEVVIHSGQIFSLANFTTSFVPGTSLITASSSGFNSGSASVSVVGPSLFSLKLYAQPDKTVTCSAGVTSCTGRIIASLVDQSGKPARAPTDVNLVLRSSNVSVVAVPQSVTITAGSVYTVFSYVVTPVQGVAVITGSYAGLQSDFATIHTYHPDGNPAALEVFAGPNPLPADEHSYDAVAVSILNATGLPTIFVVATPVTLTSSSSAVGVVDDTMTILAGSDFGVASFTSTFLSGSTQLTASATNLLPSQVGLVTYNPTPSKIVVSALPDILPADGGRYNNLQVMLEDSSGLPAIAPVDVVVQLSSSKSVIASVDDFVTIPAGKTSALTQIATSALPGGANITATAFANNSTGISLLPSFTIVNTVIPVPSKLAIYTAPPTTVLSGTGSDFMVAVQLQDASGNPARARQTVTVVVNPSNGTVLTKSFDLTIPVGADYAVSLLPPTSVGRSGLTASAPGLGSSSAQVEVDSLPMKTTLASSASSIYANQTATFTVSSTLFGSGLKGATVFWSTNSGALGVLNSTTNALGETVVLYTPSGPGSAEIVALVHLPGFPDQNLTAYIQVLPTPVRPPTAAQRLFAFPDDVVLAGGIGAAIVAIVLVQRRTRKIRKIGFDLESYRR